MKKSTVVGHRRALQIAEDLQWILGLLSFLLGTILLEGWHVSLRSGLRSWPLFYNPKYSVTFVIQVNGSKYLYQ